MQTCDKSANLALQEVLKASSDIDDWVIYGDALGQKSSRVTDLGSKLMAKIEKTLKDVYGRYAISDHLLLRLSLTL